MPINLDDPIELLFAAVDALTEAKLEHAVYGGLALAAYGAPRETTDADLAVANVSVDAARTALEKSVATVVSAFTNVPFGGLLISRLTVLDGGALNMVDLVTPASPRYAEAVLGRVLVAPLRGREVRLVTPEDFIVMKILSTREKDLEDVRSVANKLGDRIDRALIESEIASLAIEVPSHDVRGRWQRVSEWR